MKKRWPPVQPRYRILALIANRYPASLAGQEQAPHGDTLRDRRGAELGAIRWRSGSDWTNPLATKLQDASPGLT
jgi:hypothetical protein